MNRMQKTAVFGLGAAALAASIGGVSVASAGPVAKAGPGKVYQAKIVNQDIVLGPQSDPTALVSTNPLPAGTYLVNAIVGAVISSHDQIVCAVSNVPDGNDGVFGTAGNPGTGGIYGTATMLDTITVTAGQTLTVNCNSFNAGSGTYAGDAVIEATPVRSVG